MSLMTEEEDNDETTYPSFLFKFVPKYLKWKTRAEKYNMTILSFKMIKDEFFKR
jgi:hypothetical protein